MCFSCSHPTQSRNLAGRGLLNPPPAPSSSEYRGKLVNSVHTGPLDQTTDPCRPSNAFLLSAREGTWSWDASLVQRLPQTSWHWSEPFALSWEFIHCLHLLPHHHHPHFSAVPLLVVCTDPEHLLFTSHHDSQHSPFSFTGDLHRHPVWKVLSSVLDI